MKMKTKIPMLIAAILMCLGVILCIVSLIMVDFDFGGLSNVKYESNEYVFEEPVRDLSVITKTAKVNVLLAEDGVCRVVCKNEQSNAKHAVSMENGVLTVDFLDGRKWFEYLMFFSRSLSVTVYLPAGEYGELVLSDRTGAVSVDNGLSFEKAKVSCSTGHICFGASVANSLEIEMKTGDIRLKNLTAGAVTLSASTSDIELENVRCENLCVDGKTGDIDLKRVLVNGKMDISLSTGDIELDACDAAELSLQTSTGDIEGSLLSGKDFHAKSDTGRIRVPDTRIGGRCEISTATGDISIELY